MHTLRANNLSKSYSGRTVVSDVSLSVSPGEIVGLLGPNGAGKTTTFHMIVGLLRPESGSIVLDGEDIGALPMYRRAQKGISYLPQESSIWRRLSVRDNLRAVLEITGLSKDEIEARSEYLLSEFNLKEVSEREGNKLSGGERRRTEIARAVALGPRFILFDEPFAGIDPIAILELKKMLKYLKDKGLGILITDHNVRDMLSITDRAYIMTGGRLLDEGPPERLVANPKVRDLYLGEEFRL